MQTEAVIRLRHAVAAVRYGGGAATMTARVRREGPDAFETVLQGLSQTQRREIGDDAEVLAAEGVQALLLAHDGYPQSLADTRSATAALFVSGPRQLLDRPAVGFCGSRKATPAGLRAASACSRALADHDVVVVSGYARGVDAAAHAGALAAGGATVLVLAEGLGRFRRRDDEISRLWDDRRVVVVSQFSPSQPWTTGGAMARNAVISGLSLALVVVEAGATGGTLAAGLRALEQGQRVFVLEPPGTDTPGNAILRGRGAVTVRGHEELIRNLASPAAPEPTQLSLI